MKYRYFAIALGAMVLSTALAAAQTLPLGGPTPTLDGVVGAKEYSLQVPVGKITLSASRTADTVYLAVSAPTTGWVAVGFGSERMDGADMFLGYVADGKPSFSQQLGSGHSHGQLAKPLELRNALGEVSGTTTMEIAFKVADVIPAAQQELAVLVAYGANDSFSGYHLGRGVVKLKL
jgi:DOMON domain